MFFSPSFDYTSIWVGDLGKLSEVIWGSYNSPSLRVTGPSARQKAFQSVSTSEVVSFPGVGVRREFGNERVRSKLTYCGIPFLFEDLRKQ